jgi:hypothetical protein
MTSDEFQCASCKRIFKKVTTDEEADAEALRLFGVEGSSAKLGDGPDDMAIVCDDCWKAMGLGNEA